MHILIFDTETTGLLKPSAVPLDLQPQIIEFASILVDSVTGDIERTCSTLINPGKPLPPVITKITGLRDDDLRDQPSFADVRDAIAGEFALAQVAIAHNMPFDQGMLLTELRRLEDTTFPWPKTLICTVQEYLHVHGWRMNLKVFHQHIMGEELVQTHRALDDVLALHKILTKANFYKGITR